MRDRCEFIAAWWERTRGVKIDPVDIFNMSPTGELWPVFALYDEALASEECR